MPCLAPCLPCATLHWHPSFPMLVQGWGTQSVAGPLAASPSGNAQHSGSCSPRLLGVGRRLVCLHRDAGVREPSEPYFPFSLWLDVSSLLVNPPSRVLLVLWHSAQCSCSGLGSDTLCHAERSDKCQALPADVTGMIRLAEQGTQLHRTVQ